MVSATPAQWRDTCHHCGLRFQVGEPQWLEAREHFVHTKCAWWELWETPPYTWQLKPLRKRYREADQESRASIVRAGRAIREMQRTWPTDAAMHVERVLLAAQAVEV